jgi:hypothetical protein
MSARPFHTFSYLFHTLSVPFFRTRAPRGPGSFSPNARAAY